MNSITVKVEARIKNNKYKVWAMLTFMKLMVWLRIIKPEHAVKFCLSQAVIEYRVDGSEWKHFKAADAYESEQ